MQCNSADATFIEPFRFFFLQFLTSTTTTTAASSSSSSGATNYYNLSSITYNQNISIIDSNNTANVGIVGRRMKADGGPEQRVAESEFAYIRDCFNEHATRYLETVITAEQEVSNCLFNRLLEVIDVSKTVLQALDQVAGTEENSSQPFYFSSDAQSTLTRIMSGMYDCSDEMQNVLSQQSFAASNAFEKCTVDASHSSEI